VVAHGLQISVEFDVRLDHGKEHLLRLGQVSRVKEYSSDQGLKHIPEDFEVMQVENIKVKRLKVLSTFFLLINIINHLSSLLLVQSVVFFLSVNHRQLSLESRIRSLRVSRKIEVRGANI